MKRNIVWLIVGIVVFSLGLYQFWQYEENSLEVSAVITDIKSRETDDGYRHVYYGEYTVDGEKYTDVKLDSGYTDSMFPDRVVGDTVDIVVSASSPGGKMTEGGFFGVVGLALMLYNGIKLYGAKKNNKNAAISVGGTDLDN